MCDPKTTARTAHLCCIKPEEVDQAILARAVRAGKRGNSDYWNMLAHTGQLDGNMPESMIIACTYAFIAEEVQDAKTAAKRAAVLRDSEILSGC